MQATVRSTRLHLRAQAGVCGPEASRCPLCPHCRLFALAGSARSSKHWRRLGDLRPLADDRLGPQAVSEPQAAGTTAFAQSQQRQGDPWRDCFLRRRCIPQPDPVARGSNRVWSRTVTGSLLLERSWLRRCRTRREASVLSLVASTSLAEAIGYALRRNPIAVRQAARRSLSPSRERASDDRKGDKGLVRPRPSPARRRLLLLSERRCLPPPDSDRLRVLHVRECSTAFSRVGEHAQSGYVKRRGRRGGACTRARCPRVS